MSRTAIGMYHLLPYDNTEQCRGYNDAVANIAYDSPQIIIVQRPQQSAKSYIKVADLDKCLRCFLFNVFAQLDDFNNEF